MRQLWSVLPLVRPYRGGLAAGLLLVLVSNAFQVAEPKLLGLAIDSLAQPDATSLRVAGYAALVVVAALLSGAARYGMRELLNGISRRVETDLRDLYFDKLLRLDAAFYGRTRTGDLMSRATNDVQAVRQAVGPGVMYLVNTIAMSVFALALMIRISGRLTLISLVPLALLPPVVLYFGQVIHRRFEAIQDHLGDLSTFVQENLSGVRIVRAYVQEAAQERDFETLNAAYLEKNMDLVRTSGAFHPSLTLLIGLGLVVVLWFGGRLVVTGEISIGDFVAFSMYLAFLGWPMIALGWVTNLFQRGAASMRRINTVLEAVPAVREPERPARLPIVRGAIEFRDVRFRYPGSERDVLEDVSFRVEAGSTVALVGPTGSGKSTIAALLVRLYDPTAGQILLDGVPLPRLPLEQLRGAIGLVPQETFLFSETIADNIAFGLADVEDERQHVRDASAVAQLDETIAEFPRGYDTRLGERGINLSGGQRQRAALARALARDPRIVVLDDALSAVDTHTETAILEGLKRALSGRTALVISHRVSAVMNADLILVLDDGRIVERGTHAELLERAGLYSTLLRRQILSEDLEGDAASLAATPLDG